ncbi:MAG: N-acyl homoserine lactonase family protein [Burkholderiales bacterium]|nr:N-acyl homoserine lactonase family protein [Burkholderiales bacterium]
MSAASAIWRVTPLNLGRRKAHYSWFNYLETDVAQIEIVYWVWVLRCADEVVLVDTGPPVDEAERRGITAVVPVAEALAEIGIDARSVERIVLTHLHWDHASSAGSFPNAKFFAQQQEIAFFIGDAWQIPSTARFFSHRQMLRRLIESGRIESVAGDVAFLPGLRLIRVGGHTPGSQMVLVDTAAGLAVLTGDAIPMNRNYTGAIPTGILVNLLEVANAQRTVRSLRPHCIYTGHDPVACLRLEPAPETP